MALTWPGTTGWLPRVKRDESMVFVPLVQMVVYKSPVGSGSDKQNTSNKNTTTDGDHHHRKARNEESTGKGLGKGGAKRHPEEYELYLRGFPQLTLLVRFIHLGVA